MHVCSFLVLFFLCMYVGGIAYLWVTMGRLPHTPVAHVLLACGNPRVALGVAELFWRCRYHIHPHVEVPLLPYLCCLPMANQLGPDHPGLQLGAECRGLPRPTTFQGGWQLRACVHPITKPCRATDYSAAHVCS
jgi:hypothetical protein